MLREIMTQSVLCTKAKGKRQKSRMKQIVRNFADLALRQTIFAFCLLPFALPPQVAISSYR